jgi:type I restriction enzyme S subunit
MNLHLPSAAFEDVLEDVTSGNTKTLQTDYQPAGRYPVVDQGQDVIAGYLDDETALCRAELPVIVFGDHTKAFKFIDFPFCIGADGTKVLRPRSDVHPKYVFHYLRTLKLPDVGYSRHYKFLKRFDIPLPPLPEQRRIAATLDAADAFRQKRRQALRLLDQLTQAIFVEMFGDTSTLEPRPFSELLSRPLRNGLSPSRGGAITAPVLTLSAVTSGVFKADAIKEGTFLATPPANQCVQEGEFLICRGNGNRCLVGVGVLADRSMPDTAFPDTVIAGGVDQRSLDPDYFAYVWNSTAVRQQIEAAARTTNGTFKVNQAALHRIEVPVPDLTRQSRFGDCLRNIRELEGVERKHLSEADALFASLQHRAFRGEL